MLNLKHLYYFHVFAQELSTTRAATRLLISAPALSNQIKELEGFLGFKLAERVRGKFQVTDLGKTILEYTERIFLPYEELRHKISSKLNFKTEHLQIGISAFLDPCYSVDQIIETAKMRSPTIKKTSLVCEQPDKLVSDLIEGKLHMIIGAFDGSWSDENKWFCKEMKSPVQLVVPVRLLESLKYENKEHLQRDLQALIEFAESVKILFVLPVDSILREETDRFLQNSNIVLKKTIECNTSIGMNQLIAHQVAMGFMPLASTVDEQVRSKIAVLGPQEGFWSHTISIISLCDKGLERKDQHLDRNFATMFSSAQ